MDIERTTKCRDMGKNMHRLVVLAAFIGLMLVWESGDGRAMTCVESCMPLATDDVMDEMAPWRHEEFIHGFRGDNAGVTSGIFLSRTGSSPGDGLRKAIYGSSVTWITFGPDLGNGKTIVSWNGSLLQKIDLPLGNENEWRNYFHDQYAYPSTIQSIGDSKSNTSLVTGPAVMIMLGSALAGIFFWGNKRRAVSKSRYRHGVRHRYER